MIKGDKEQELFNMIGAIRHKRAIRHENLYLFLLLLSATGNISLHAVHVPCPPLKMKDLAASTVHILLLSKHRNKLKAVNKNSTSHLEDLLDKRNTVE